MDRIRVLFVDSRLLRRQIVREVFALQPDIDIVGEVESRADVLSTIDERRAQFVIVGSNGAGSLESYDVLLRRRPHLRILAIVEDGRRSFLYELAPQLVSLGPPSPETLLGVIRESVRSQASLLGEAP
jgi:DNA-binding NarL/FixJ family response regulator